MHELNGGWFERIARGAGYNLTGKCSHSFDSEGFMCEDNSQVSVVKLEKYNNTYGFLYEIWADGKYVKTVDHKGKWIRKFTQSQLN